LDSVGAEHFAAIVSDNGANVKLAREIITTQYPHIFNIRCVAHAVNLVAQDILKYEWADKLIKKYNILYNFFKASHQAGIIILFF